MDILGLRCIFCCFFILFFSYSKLAFSLHESTPCDASLSNPCVVQDTSFHTAQVTNLRDTSMIAQYYQEDTAGIDALWSSGSAIPSQEGWNEIADYIRDHSPQRPKQIIVVDLRQESHGYLNGQAINLTTLYNWINLNKKKSQVLKDEANWLNQLKNQPFIDGVLTPKQFHAKEYGEGRLLAVNEVNSEEELVKAAGLKYKRFTVSDHQAATDEEVDDFVQFYQSLPSRTWLHFHCRGGKGRTTSFMVMVDMLNNAHRVSFHDIIARHASLPPFYNLAEVIRDTPELTPYYEARFLFLSNFYRYAQDVLNGYEGKWTEWKMEAKKA